MGLYIEVNNKVKWCEDNGIEVEQPTFINDDYLICCLIDNNIFYALSVLYSKTELKAFMDTKDKRDKRFFKIHKKLIKENAPDYNLYIN